MLFRYALAFVLIGANQSAAQSLMISIDTVEPPTDGFISYCNFSGNITNTSTDTAHERVVVEHRLRPDTFSAMTAMENGGIGQELFVEASNIAAGASAPFAVSFLGIDCTELDAVNFALLCHGDFARACTATLAAAKDSLLPIQIGDADVVGDDLIERGPLHGMWQVTGPDDMNLMTLEVNDTPGTYIEMTFRRGPDYCGIAAHYCDQTPMEITNDRIYLRDDGDVRATLIVNGTSHSVLWDLETGNGTFSDAQFKWDKADVNVTLIKP